MSESTNTRADQSEPTPIEPGLRRAFGRGLRKSESPATAPQPEQFDGRYELLEIIGQGGMGVVWRAHDRELDREVALKLLRAELGANPERCRRFVEEAKIAGALQHPGIVPVYDRGVTDEGEPYFTMKLVRGETLKARLATLPAVVSERAALLSTMLRVAEAVAAAHAQAVIHRDLKPSNIMLGALGEVLVMDFGLAKLLSDLGPQERTERRTEPWASPSGSDTTRTGAVLGTPLYMAPEQALGQASRHSARSDVYSLGSMIFEVLAGRPFALKAPSEPPDKDAHAAEEFAALKARGWDEALLTLVRECVATDPAERPEHAGIVASRLAAHLAAQDAARRAAETALLAAAASARSERRARILTTTLFSVVIVAALSGAWAWWSGEQKGRARESLANSTAATAIRQLSIAATEARSRTTDDLALWQKATAMLEGAASPWKSASVRPELRDEGEALAMQIRSGLDAALAAESARQREQAMVAELDRVRSWYADLRRFGDDDQAYSEAFTRFGIDIDRLPADEVRARIEQSPIRDRLLNALLDWSRVRLSVPAKRHARDGAYLLNIAGTMIDTPELRHVFELIGNRDDAAAQDAADKLDMRSVPITHLVFIGDWLLTAKAPGKSIDFLKRALVLHPDSGEAIGSLVYALEELNDPSGFAEGVRYLMAACALRPDSTYLRACVGNFLDRSGDKAGAKKWFDQLEAIMPDDLHFLYFRGLFARTEGDLERAIACFRRVLAQDPKFFPAKCVLGVLLVRNKETAEGERLLRGVLNTVNYEAHMALGLLSGERGELAEAEHLLFTARNLAPSRFEAAYLYGTFLGKHFRSERAAHELQRAITLAPADEPSLNREKLNGAIADCIRISARSAGLAADLERAAEVVTDALTWSALLRWLRDQGRAREEAETWETARKLAPKLLERGFEASAEAWALAAQQSSDASDRRHCHEKALAELQLESQRLSAPGFDADSARRRREFWLRHPAFESLRQDEPTGGSAFFAALRQSLAIRP